MAELLTPLGYMSRVADREVERALRASPAVLIEGPRACGKTWTGRRHARSEVPFDAVFESRLAAQVAPREVLDGPVPRLLDEWQLAPDVWDAMRRVCDDRGRKGQFILTGSADPPDEATRHTGTGRIIRVRMRPMSLFESGESTGRISLGGLLASERASAPADPVWSRTVHPTPVLLFRYSALTMNCHRIHYDLDYARDVEACPGLLVHGPLTMTLMLDLFRREMPGAWIESFDLRAVAPVYDTTVFSVHGAPGDEPGKCKLWAMTGDGALAMTADVTFSG